MSLFKKSHKNKTIKVKSPISGIIKSLSSLNDGFYSEEKAGPGVVIEPSSNILVSPIDGIIVSAFPGGHAYGIKSHDGKISILIHVGIETTKYNYNFFDIKVEQGQKINAGDQLAIVDFDKIKNTIKHYQVILNVLPILRGNSFLFLMKLL